MESGNLGAVSPTSVWVFVDSTEDHDLNGRLASPAFGITTFSGVLALITRMEQFYNEKRFPQSSMQIRSFHKKKRGKTAEEKPSVPAAEQRGDLEEMLARIGMEEPGKRATFVISVLFRAGDGALAQPGPDPAVPQHARTDLADGGRALPGRRVRRAGPVAGIRGQNRKRITMGRFHFGSALCAPRGWQNLSAAGI